MRMRKNPFERQSETLSFLSGLATGALSIGALWTQTPIHLVAYPYSGLAEDWYRIGDDMRNAIRELSERR